MNFKSFSLPQWKIHQKHGVKGALVTSRVSQIPCQWLKWSTWNDCHLPEKSVNCNLGGGFNPFGRPKRSFPQVGVKMKNAWNHHLATWFPQQFFFLQFQDLQQHLYQVLSIPQVIPGHLRRSILRLQIQTSGLFSAIAAMVGSCNAHNDGH